jgi:hypothetical protein
VKNGKCPIKEAVKVKLSGVVSVPHTPHHNSDALEKWIISSFSETRFQNVLKRATVRSRLSWFWHHLNQTHLSDRAIAIISATINDYIQVLTKRYQLVETVRELDPLAELLLLIDPEQDFVFGIVLSTGEFFSTHILLCQKREGSKGVGRKGETGNFSSSPLHPTPCPNSSSSSPLHPSPCPQASFSARHQTNDLALYSNNRNRRY